MTRDTQSVKNRAAVWDQLAPGELAFDFSARTTRTGNAGLEWKDHEKVGVKEAIVRWLEEQL